ncbi:hypothetical protein ACM66B_006642 [Microbotryomycetes sp. NB124-2]
MGWTRNFFHAHPSAAVSTASEPTKIKLGSEVTYIEHAQVDNEHVSPKRRARPRHPNPETLWLASGGRDPVDEDDLPLITPEEVALHNNPAAGIWIIVEDRVYDCTHYTEMHPGGPEVFAQGSSAHGNSGSGTTGSTSKAGVLLSSSDE